MGDDNNILKPEDTDKLAQAVIALTREVWVLRDRQKVLEAVLAEAGLLDTQKLEQYEPDEALSAELKAEREQMISKVLSALTG